MEENELPEEETVTLEKPEQEESSETTKDLWEKERIPQGVVSKKQTREDPEVPSMD